MKKSIFIVGILLFIVFSTVQAQNKPKQTTIDSTQILWQALVQPSFQYTMNQNSIMSINYRFNQSNSILGHYLNIFNSMMTKFILAKTNKYIELNDFSTYQYVPFNITNAFQYNFALERTELYYISDLQKSNW